MRRLLLGVLASFLASVCSLSASEIPDLTTADVHSRLAALTTPDTSRLAQALGVEPPTKEEPSESVTSYLQDLGDLDGSEEVV